MCCVPTQLQSDWVRRPLHAPVALPAPCTSRHWSICTSISPPAPLRLTQFRIWFASGWSLSAPTAKTSGKPSISRSRASTTLQGGCARAHSCRWASPPSWAPLLRLLPGGSGAAQPGFPQSGVTAKFGEIGEGLAVGTASAAGGEQGGRRPPPPARRQPGSATPPAIPPLPRRIPLFSHYHGGPGAPSSRRTEAAGAQAASHIPRFA